MFTPSLLHRFIVLCFMVLVGFALARGIQSGSVLGLVLSAVSLAAASYFFYLLSKINESREEKKA